MFKFVRTLIAAIFIAASLLVSPVAASALPTSVNPSGGICGQRVDLKILSSWDRPMRSRIVPKFTKNGKIKALVFKGYGFDSRLRSIRTEVQINGKSYVAVTTKGQPRTRIKVQPRLESYTGWWALIATASYDVRWGRDPSKSGACALYVP